MSAVPRGSLRAGLCLFLLGAPGCQVAQSCRMPTGGLERMLEQPRYDAFGESRFFSDGLTMRAPPEGTVRFDAPTPKGALATGFGADGGFVREVPLQLTREQLEQGRKQYEIVCATCHGLTGTADTPVARNMPLRPPPALVDVPYREYPPGRIYRAVQEGFGLMPPFRTHLPSAEERWAVVAYVKVLQRSQHARLADVPQDVRARLLSGSGP